MKTIPPLNNQSDAANPAADLIRQKLNQLYSDEPNAKEELQEAKTASPHRSKHQQYMYDLSRSGKSLAQIQTDWHNYYQALPDPEKHKVWQEFYEEHERLKAKPPAESRVQPEQLQKPADGPATMPAPAPTIYPSKTVSELKAQLLKRIGTRSAQKGGHLKSMAFGLSSGLIVIVILLFSFFNERFIAPFISPSKTVSDTQIIIDPNSTAAGPNPEIIIPKINVEIPVVYTEQSIDDHSVDKALESGVLHYPTTSNPGELGNGAIFGHSSNNIINPGKYKFAFVLLHRLEAGDTFILQKDGKRYVYKIFTKKVVKPQDVSVIDDTQGKAATFSLITCDPPGTSLNRLVVTGEQITPDPSSNIASTAKSSGNKPAILPSNSPSLWQRLTGWLAS